MDVKMNETCSKLKKPKSVFTLCYRSHSTSRYRIKFAYSNLTENEGPLLSVNSHELTQNGHVNDVDRERGDDSAGNDQYNPFEHRNKTHSTTDLGSLIHIIKSSLGTGVLAMPNAFAHGGLIFGIFGTIFVGYLCTYCVNVLVKCSRILSKRTRVPCLSFAETAQVSFQTGPEFLRPYAGLAKGVVRLALFCAYYLGAAAYIVLIATSFQQVVEDQTDWRMNIRLYILIVGIPLIPLGIIRTLKYLVPFTTAATVLIAFGLGITLYFTFVDLPPLSSRPFIVSPVQWPLFFSTTLFSMEGIGTVLPIENSMQNPEHFLGCAGVLNIAMTLIVILYGLVGFFGFVKFGEFTQGSITLNLDPSNGLAEIVKILVALSVLLTFGLQFCVPSEVVWDIVGHRFKKSPQMAYRIIRGTLIVGTIIVAVLIPNLSPIISLVGAVGYSMLGLFCPSMIELATCYDDGFGPFKWVLIKNVVIIFVAIFFLISGTYASLIEIINDYTS